jgi:hypothetical protein
MRHQLYSISVEVDIEYGGRLMKLFNEAVSESVGKATQSLCFGAASRTTEKDLVISGHLRQYKKERHQNGSLSN